MSPHPRQQPGTPGPAFPASQDAPGLAGASTSFVLALARCGRSTLTPAAAPALTGTYPGKAGMRNPPRTRVFPDHKCVTRFATLEEVS